MPKADAKPLNHYGVARKALGLSRADVSNYARRAGHNLSASAIDRLEKSEDTTTVVGSRGLSTTSVAYLDYLYGMGEFEQADWTAIERGAPVLVHGEAGQWSYSSVNPDGSVQVFGGKGSVAQFRSFDPSRVKLVAPTAIPTEDLSSIFASATRGPRGSNGVYATEVLSYFDKHSGQAHSVGALAYALGRDNGLVSRTVAALSKKGLLVKVGRGVFIKGDGSAPAETATPEATPEATTDAPAAEASEVAEF